MWFLLILDPILPIFKKNWKIYFGSEYTVLRSNSTFLDQILLIFNDNSIMTKFYLFWRKIDIYIYFGSDSAYFRPNSPFFSRKIAVLDEKYILDQSLRFLDQISHFFSRKWNLIYTIFILFTQTILKIYTIKKILFNISTWMKLGLYSKVDPWVYSLPWLQSTSLWVSKSNNILYIQFPVLSRTLP